MWLLLTVVGLALGTLYYLLVAQAALSGEIQWRQAFTHWPWASFQVLGLSLFLTLFMFVVGFPASCLVSLSALNGMAVSQCVFFLYGGFLIWLLFPLLLSAHGIFVNQDKMLASIRRGSRLTRLTVISTGLLFMVIILLTQGLNMLWNVTEENSWLSLVSIVGHAIVTTGLLAATFLYYRDADQWVRQALHGKNVVHNA
jgi:hypothetical protein